MEQPKMLNDEDSGAYQAVDEADVLSKVPRVTFAFWVVKVLATTLGETGGDALSMTPEARVRREHADLSRALYVHPLRPGEVQALSPGLLLGSRGGHHDRRYDDIGLFRSHARSRLRKVLDHPLVSGDRRARRLAPCDGRHQGRPDHRAEGRGLLLGYHPGVEHARNRLGRFRRDDDRPGLRARFAGLRRADRPRGGGPLHHEPPEYRAFLGGLRPDAAPRGDARRYAYKAARRGRAGARPDWLVACDRGGNGRPHCRHVAP